MSSLPASRVSVSRLFSRCGVNYARPFLLREGKRRNARSHKSYVFLFVYFATKTVHLELISDLTSETFIAAFKRFISRRSRPTHMYSDNETTFVGAHKQIQELYDIYNDQQVQSEIKDFLRELEISSQLMHSILEVCGRQPWNLPNIIWLGSWARLIWPLRKCKRKFLCEIEAILNSRPLLPLSADPNDLAYLNSGYFLVGTTLNGLPCVDLSDVNKNRLLRWQRVEQTRQHF